MNGCEGLTEALTEDELASVVGGNSDPDDPVPAVKA
jgi:bacteriocin-like protein